MLPQNGQMSQTVDTACFQFIILATRLQCGSIFCYTVRPATEFEICIAYVLYRNVLKLQQYTNIYDTRPSTSYQSGGSTNYLKYMLVLMPSQRVGEYKHYTVLEGLIC